MFEAGSGIRTLGMKLPADVANRIEWLGKMNDRRRECVANGDVDGLRVLASEYAARNMLRTSNGIYLEIDVLRKAAR